MNPYMLTLTFLLLMSVLTSSEVVRFSESQLGMQTHEHLVASQLEAEKERADAALDDFRKDESESDKDDALRKGKTSTPSKSVRRSAPLGFNLARPPNNSRLNFNHILHNDPEGIHREAAARLMRRLYEKTTFFDAISQVEYHILEALKDHDTSAFNYPDELNTLEFENKNIQRVFYAMLKGAEGRPSLLNYITFDQGGTSYTKKLNLLFVSPEVLRAYFDDSGLVAALIELRDRQWEEILDQEAHRLERTRDECKGRDPLKKELTEGVERIFAESHFDDELYKQMLDLSLGKLGNILFIEDSVTGFVRREKYVPRQSRSKG